MTQTRYFTVVRQAAYIVASVRSNSIDGHETMELKNGFLIFVFHSKPPH